MDGGQWNNNLWGNAQWEMKPQRNKKILELWQILFLNLFLGFIIVSIFIPAFRLEDGYEVRYLSPGRIMISDLYALQIYLSSENVPDTDMQPELVVNNEKVFHLETMASYSGRSKGTKLSQRAVVGIYSTLRVWLWIVYSFAVGVWILTLAAYGINLVKWIPLTFNIILGIGSSVWFGILYFGTAGILASRQYPEPLTAYGYERKYALMDLINDARFFSFLVAFLGAVLLLIFSVVFLFAGNSEKATQGYGVPDAYPPSRNNIPNVYPPTRNNIPNAYPPLRNDIPNVYPPSSHDVPKVYTPPAHVDSPKGEMVCIKGSASGTGCYLESNHEVVVGRDPRYANFIINQPKVSSMHCSLRFHEGKNMYIVKDFSKNGTFVNGVRLEKEVDTPCDRGTILSLSDGQDEILLK